MATYFKYAERSADSFVNWAEIGKNLSDTLREENRIREEKKAAIDKATREYGEQLANAPQGENRDVNRWTLNFADEAQQARLLQDRLLKSGMLKLKDYNIQRQNLTDGTRNLFNLSKEYQQEYATKMERMKSMDPKTRSQALETYLMSTAEGFANFADSKALINPTDYTVGVGMLKKNPETGVVEVTGETSTVNALRNRIKSKFDYFDVDEANTGIAKKLGEYVKAEIQRGSSSRAGLVITTEDAMKRPGYQNAIDEAIQSFLVTPYNVSSVLTQNIGIEQSTGKAFSFTFNEEEAKKNKNLILLKTVNDMAVPQFTKEQEDAVKSFMKGQIEQQIKHDEKINPFAEPRPERATQAELEWARDQKYIRNMGNLVGNLYDGTDDQITAAVDYFNGLSTVGKFSRTPTGIKLTYPNGASKKVSFVDDNGKPIEKNNFVRGATSLLLGDDADINLAVQGSLSSKGKNLNTRYSYEGKSEVAAKQNPIEKFKELLKLKKELDYGNK